MNGALSTGPIQQSPLFSAKSIKLGIKCSLLKSPDDLPDGTTIEGDNGLMEELFGTISKNINWLSVKQRFLGYPNTSDANLSALKEISRAIFVIFNNNRLLPLQGAIFVENGPKRYRPVISHAEKLSTGHISCRILFIEEVGGQLLNVNKSLGVLLTCIRMAVRIGSEIVQPFLPNLQILAQVDPRRIRFDLQTCFNNILLDAEFRGNNSPADVWMAFESDKDKSKISAMIDTFQDTYPKIWKSLGFDAMQTFGEVSDQPFSSEDLALLEAELRKLAKVNRDFLDIAVVRAGILTRHLFTLEEEGEQFYRPERSRHRHPVADLPDGVEPAESRTHPREKIETRGQKPGKLQLNDSTGLDEAAMSILNRDKVFISYSHEDRKAFEEFKIMLAPVIRGNKV
jgi:hypothetical protein